MEKDLILMLIGALIEAILGNLVPKCESKLRIKYWDAISRHRMKLLQGGRVRRWIEQYYSDRGLLKQLYCCRIGTIDQRIPVLTQDSWCKRVALGSRPIIDIVNTAPQDFKHNERLLRRRSSMGQRMFNDMALYPDRIDIYPASIKIVTRRCRYLSIASNLISVEEELFRAADKLFLLCDQGTPLRDRALCNLDIASQFLLKPQSIGCAAVLRLATNEGDKLLIHRRSSQVITSAGSIAVMPCFGLEPVDGATNHLENDVLMLNLVKEFCEELLGVDDLISTTKHREGLGSWILQFPAADMLFSALKSGNASTTLLGMGIDATNGTLILAIEVYISYLPIAERISTLIIGNWEVAERTSDQQVIELVPITDSRFADWLLSDALSYPSAFALSLALAN